MLIRTYPVSLDPEPLRATSRSKAVKGILEAVATIGYKELKKNGVFVVPGFAKFVVVKKPATWDCCKRWKV